MALDETTVLVVTLRVTVEVTLLAVVRVVAFTEEEEEEMTVEETLVEEALLATELVAEVATDKTDETADTAFETVEFEPLGLVYRRLEQLEPSHFLYRERAADPPQYSLLLPAHEEKQFPRTPVTGARSSAMLLPQ